MSLRTIPDINHLPDKTRLVAAAVSFFLISGCTSLIDNSVANSIISEKSSVPAYNEAHAMGPHMMMTKKQQVKKGDTKYTKILASQLREDIAQFKDVKVAEEAGYRSFPPNPGPDLKEIHYVNTRLSGEQAKEFNPRKPGSLLYERTGDGGLKLIGAMLTAPPNATLNELNDRVPLSVTQWHLHTNICIPVPMWDEQQWAREFEGKPMFGPESDIDNKRDCDLVGGRFAPVIFDWMTHAYVYRNSDSSIWDQMSGHHKH